MMAALRFIGAASLTYAAFKLFDYASFYLLPPASLARYRTTEDAWALVTGASAGIGLGTAQELAARGFNVVLLGHLPAELDAAAALVRAERRAAQVRVVVLDAIASTPHEIEAALGPIAALPVTVLVNNVGGFPIDEPTLRYLSDYTAEDLDRSLNINARFMAHVSRVLLPRLAENGPALVLNMSSASRMGIPWAAPYSGCKGFVISFTASVAREMIAAGSEVDCVAIVPGDVHSQSNTLWLSPGSPDSRQYAKAMLDRAPRAARRGWLECAPWFAHALGFALLDILPGPAVLFLLTEFAKQKEAAARALKRA
ncbi:NAD(P)-binding protein [Durotheca rogersii]|uniref:NAD(P)-binding protein n=1 Tax=Durotheca rogersii TaxID=419775 RepID=UPI00222060B6|nr:NAD(P)-binding protein [Durotheca rogersii]KAI5864424.1 NAD(P)-binding protein [Durotheca rogersii]